MELATEAKTYRSPSYKLIAFFVKSRNQWKEKAQAAQARVVQLTDALEQQKRAIPGTAAAGTSIPRTTAHRTGTLRATAR
jgi:hypothetical protein